MQHLKSCFSALCLIVVGAFSVVSAQEAMMDRYYDQTVEVFMSQPPTNQELLGKIEYETTPFRIAKAKFYLVSEFSELLVWSAEIVDPKVVTVSDTLSSMNFSLDVSSASLSGGYYLYVGLFDNLEKRVGTGKKALIFDENPNVDAVQDVEVVHKESEGMGEVVLSFLTNEEDKRVRPVIVLYENSLEGREFGRYEGDFIETDGISNVAMRTTFPWPSIPESYVVVARVEDEAGTIRGGESVKRIVVEGEFGEIIDISPNPQYEYDLGTSKKLDLVLRGFVPQGQIYELFMDLNELSGEGEEQVVVENQIKSKTIQGNEVSLFEIEESFQLSAESDLVNLKVQIVNSVDDSIIEEKVYEWQKRGSGMQKRTISTDNLEEVAPSPWLRLGGVMGVVVLILLILVVFIKSRKKKTL